MRCVLDAARYRYQLESIFYENRVDMVIAGHMHNYERSYPVYKRIPTSSNYTNPTAPVYTVVGTAGISLYNDWRATTPSWCVSESRIVDFGFSQIFSSSEGLQSFLRFDWIYSDSGTVGDSFTISKRTPDERL